jgi:transposase
MLEKLKLPIGFKDENFFDRYKTERRGLIKIRFLAMHHLQQGYSLADVSRFIGDTDQSIREWLHWYAKGGIAYLQSKSFHRGRRKKLTSEQEIALKEEVLKLQEARYNGKVTGNEIRQHINTLWGVHFATGSIYTVLKRLNLFPLKKLPKEQHGRR